MSLRPGHPEASPITSRRDEIVHATIQVIGRKGLAGASIRAIAHEIGLSIGVVTHHFINKSALLCAALETCFQPWKATVDASRSIENPLEQLRFVLFSTLAGEGHPAAQMQVWLGLLAQIDLDPTVTVAYRSQYQRTRQDIVAILDACDREGLLAKGLILEDEATRLLALSDGLLVSNAGDPEFYTEERIKRLIGQQIDMLV